MQRRTVGKAQAFCKKVGIAPESARLMVVLLVERQVLTSFCTSHDHLDVALNAFNMFHLREKGYGFGLLLPRMDITDLARGRSKLESQRCAS
jgi:hypothetical protein